MHDIIIHVCSVTFIIVVVIVVVVVVVTTRLLLLDLQYYHPISKINTTWATKMDVKHKKQKNMAPRHIMYNVQPHCPTSLRTGRGSSDW